LKRVDETRFDDAWTGCARTMTDAVQLSVVSQFGAGTAGAVAHVGLETQRCQRNRVLEIGVTPGEPDSVCLLRIRGAVARSIFPGAGRGGALGCRHWACDKWSSSTGDIARRIYGVGAVHFSAHGVYSGAAGRAGSDVVAFVRRLAPDGGLSERQRYPGGRPAGHSRRHAIGRRRQRELREGPRGTQMVDFLESARTRPTVYLHRSWPNSGPLRRFRDGSYLLHEEPQRSTATCLFYEMVGRVGAQGLAYLAEAPPEEMFPRNAVPGESHWTGKCGGVQCWGSSTAISPVNRMFANHAWSIERAPRSRYHRARPVQSSAYAASVTS